MKEGEKEKSQHTLKRMNESFLSWLQSSKVGTKEWLLTLNSELFWISVNIPGERIIENWSFTHKN